MTGVAGLLGAVLDTPGRRLLGTVALFAALVALVAGVRWLGPPLKRRYSDPFVDAAQAVAVTLLAVAAVALSVAVWGVERQGAGALDALNVNVGLVVATVATLAGAAALTRGTKRAVHGLTGGALSRHQREVAHHLVQVGVYSVAVLLVLALWRVDIGNILLGAGVFGVVVGLAARQTLGAVLAGFVVLLSRPFDVGDWVEIGDHEGTVRNITIVNTRLRTFDDEIVMVPNDIVTGTEVVNRSRRGRLRVSVEVGVDYGTDIEEAMGVAADAMADVEETLDSPAPRAVADRFGDSAVVLRCRFWIEDPDARTYWSARTGVIDAVHGAFADAGISIPFPQRSLSARSDVPVEVRAETAADDEAEGDA